MDLSSPSPSPPRHRRRKAKRQKYSNQTHTSSSSSSSHDLSSTKIGDGWLTTRKGCVQSRRRTYTRATDPNRDDRDDADALDKECDFPGDLLNADKHNTKSTYTVGANRQHIRPLPSWSDTGWMSPIRRSTTTSASSSSSTTASAAAANNNINNESCLRNIDGGAPSTTNNVLPQPPESPGRKPRAKDSLLDENDLQQSPQYHSPLPRSRQDEEDYDGSPDLLASDSSDDEQSHSPPTSTTTNHPSSSTTNHEKLAIAPLQLQIEKEEDTTSATDHTISSTTTQHHQQPSSTSATLHTCSNNNGSCACLDGTSFLPSAAVQEQQQRPFKIADIRSAQETAKITSVLRAAQENASKYTTDTFWGGAGRRGYINNAKKKSKFSGTFMWTPIGKSKCKMGCKHQASPTLCAFAVNLSSFILRNTVVNSSVNSWKTFSDACLTDIFVMSTDVSVTDVTTIRGKIPTIAAAAQLMIEDMNQITKTYRDTNILDADQEGRHNTVVTFLEQLVDVRYDYVELRTAEDLPLLPWEDTPIDDVLPPCKLLLCVWCENDNIVCIRRSHVLYLFYTKSGRITHVSGR